MFRDTKVETPLDTTKRFCSARLAENSDFGMSNKIAIFEMKNLD